jgi:CubicO group peptidase (beta-lactamase class C family)
MAQRRGKYIRVRKLSLSIVVLGATLALQPGANAQSLTFSLFERYLDSLREQAGIPGMSAAILQNGVTVWGRGFGRLNVNAPAPPTLDTPYLIGNLSQTFGATLVLKKCFDEGHAELTDWVRRWESRYSEPTTTLYELLTHLAPGGAFRYDPSRFAALTAVLAQCHDVRYDRLLADEVFEPLGMVDSVPGHALSAPTGSDQALFTPEALERYAAVVRRMAVPYRLDIRGRATRSDITPVRADVANGIITTVNDLARFDRALNAGVLLTPATRQAAWTQGNDGLNPIPTGLGWFVQNYRNEPIIWQFGLVDGGHSSLIMKVPNRGITMILLANSDGLSAPFALENGDITTSLFAQLGLRLLVP